MNVRTLAALPLIAALGLLGSCGESGGDGSASTTPVSTSASGTTAPGDSSEWLLDAAPENVVDIAATKILAAEGDEITLRGIIGGRMDAMNDEAAFFVMMDAGLTNPCLADDDHCPTPWDYCCMPLDTINANNATVRLVGAGGGMREINLRDHGFRELDEVIVVGTVGPRPTEQVLTISATKIYRAGG